VSKTHQAETQGHFCKHPIASGRSNTLYQNKETKLTQKKYVKKLSYNTEKKTKTKLKRNHKNHNYSLKTMAIPSLMFDARQNPYKAVLL
jgi:hypothetical protein